jgi:hypothetical protein
LSRSFLEHPVGPQCVDARRQFNGYGCGTVFEIRPDGKEKLLKAFCSKAGCADGAGPQFGLISDSAGNLYGATSQGAPQIRNALGAAALFMKLPIRERKSCSTHLREPPMALPPMATCCLMMRAICTVRQHPAVRRETERCSGSIWRRHAAKIVLRCLTIVSGNRRSKGICDLQFVMAARMGRF